MKNDIISLIYENHEGEDREFINDVLKGIKERSNGTVHMSLDFDVLIKRKNNGESVEFILDHLFNIIDKVESGEIKSEPFSFDDSQKKGWCGETCECYPNPATESEKDKVTRLASDKKADEIISRHIANIK